jgi:teichoic acid glycerol-phosphate primase
MHQRSIAITTGPDTYLDHLGVICYIMQIPLIVTEEQTYQSALRFYPQIEVIKKEYADLTLDFLANEYDSIFESGKFWASELAPLLKLFFQKEMRFIFCPHGNSDKGYSSKSHMQQDISLVYGSHMLDLLRKTGAIHFIHNVIITGNYRYPFYRKYQPFYDNLIHDHVLHRLSKKKPPTWQDGENPTSFFIACEQIIQELSKDFNLIIKLHPFLEEFHPAQTHAVLDKYETVQDVVLLSHFPAIYPLLHCSDLYLGDFSSIGYDFLAFDKPMYFFNPLAKNNSNEQGYFLHQCGLEVPMSESTSLRAFIQSTLEINRTQKSSLRKSIYQYAFGDEQPFSTIQQTILNAMQRK